MTVSLRPRHAPAPSNRVDGIVRGLAGPPLPGIRLRRTSGPGADVLLTSASTLVRRGEAGKPLAAVTLAALQFGDQVSARIGAGGSALEVTATYGIAEDVVREFGPLTPFAMPYVVTASDGRRRVIDLAAPLHTPRINARLWAVPLGEIDIAPGDRVRLRFNPSTGRVFEVWKT